ncbi:amino acid adenylation domain-containing protein [Amycolatopsis sp. cmx-11-32]|uniref:amino acid adenylation domain-containing protein n=1 Tax=Amycolatopsis sp. cmx-11-32 TaxID=2785796 RepID=UPI0039E3DD69
MNGGGMLVPDMVTAVVARQPDAVAVEAAGMNLTYRQLDDAATALAAVLRARGVGPETCVAVCFERSPALVVAMLAVLKAGGFYVALDPEYPATRLDLMTDQARAVVVVGDRPSASRLPDTLGIPIVVVDDNGRADIPSVERGTASEVRPGHTAYVVYTSGSTGTPKAVVVPHSALRWFVTNMAYADPGPRDVIALASSPSFDALAFECWTALCHGARLRVVPRSVLLSPQSLTTVLRGVTMMYVTAALLQQLAMEAPEFAAGLRVLFFGGQRADFRAVSLVRKESAPARLIQVYGPTETTIWSSHQTVDFTIPADWIPLGTPIAGSTEYLLDEWLRPVAAGGRGEIYLGGDGVARGYLDRPDLTAERFLPDPFRPDRAGALMYRTGDLARLRDDGAMEFLGRADGQVKIRGFRIELGEIELALATHPAVATVVVTAAETAGGTQLIAHYVPVSGVRPPDAQQLRQYLADRLPLYSVPGFFQSWTRIPLAPNGKIDRGALAPALTPDGRIDRRALGARRRSPDNETLIQQRN